MQKKEKKLKYQLLVSQEEFDFLKSLKEQGYNPQQVLRNSIKNIKDYLEQKEKANN